MSYGFDRFIYPVEITTDNQILYIKDGGVLKTIVLDVGTYYAHNDSALNATHPSFFIALKTKLDAGTGLVWSFEAATPSASTEQAFAGIKIIADGSWEMGLASDLHSTGLVGFTRTSGYLADDGDDTLTAYFTLGGIWTPPEEATDKRSFGQKILDYSTEYTEVDDFYATNRGDRTIRTFICEYLTAAHIHSTRGNDAAYASSGGLATGDVHNAFEDLWRAWASGQDIIVVHDSAPHNLDVDGEGYEIVRCADVEFARSMERCAQMMRSGGEYYRITLPCVVVDAGDYSGQ